MIAGLKGIVVEASPGSVILEVGGVSYLVFVSQKTQESLPESGREIRLRIETHVREDQISLYGFGDAIEQEWFRLLQTVQGVGAKVAMSVLGTLEPDALHQAVATGDQKVVSRAPGVGPKLAQRIVNELASRLPSNVISLPQVQDSRTDELASALVNLGYGRAQVDEAVAAALIERPDGTLQELIRAALQRLAPAAGGPKT